MCPENYVVENNVKECNKAMTLSPACLMRAVVIAINEDAAIRLVVRAINGDAVFSGDGDEDKFCRYGYEDEGGIPREERPAFDAENADVTLIGDVGPSPKGSRILAWEILITPEPGTTAPDNENLE
jgi:hypothetical protein